LLRFLFRAPTRLRPIDVATHTFDSVTETHRQHRLSRILENVNNSPLRILKEDIFAIGQQMDFGIGRRSLNQTPAKFLLEKTNDLAHALETKSAAAEFADDGDLSEIFKGVKATVAVAGWNHDSAFIHPLELTGGDAREFNHLVGIERDQHCLLDTAIRSCVP
jgi:hypothetical protein